MTNLKKRKNKINVDIDIGKYFLDICIHEKKNIGKSKTRPMALRSFYVDYLTIMLNG